MECRVQYLLTEEEYKNGSAERCAELEETCIKLTKDVEDYQKTIKIISTTTLRGCDNICRVSCAYSSESLIKAGIPAYIAEQVCSRQHQLTKIGY